MSRRTDRRSGGVLAALGTFVGFLGAGILLVGEVFQGIFLGAAGFVLFRTVFVRGVLLRDHRSGLLLAEQKRFAEALDAFERSEAAWSGRAWLDRWRGFLLASAGRWGFADQARYNRALCLHQLGRSTEAATVLEHLLQSHPDMGMARALSEHIQSTDAPPADWTDLL